jgi:hypothetical protein
MTSWVERERKQTKQDDHIQIEKILNSMEIPSEINMRLTISGAKMKINLHGRLNNAGDKWDASNQENPEFLV